MTRGGYLVLDIETIPDTELYTPPTVPMGEEKPFPPIYAHVPIAIGVLWLDTDLAFKRIGIIGESKNEASQLTAFSEFVSRESPTLVSWNGRSFDLPVIVLRSMRHGIPLRWYYERRDLRYRFSDDGHLDLADALADRGATKAISLDNAARLIGLPGKMGVDGSQVDGLYRAGQLDQIRHYCLTDVIQTAFLLLRYLHLTGRHPADSAHNALGQLHEALVADGRFAELLDQCDRPRLLLESTPSH